MLRYRSERWLRTLRAGLLLYLVAVGANFIDFVVDRIMLSVGILTDNDASSWRAITMIALEVVACYLITTREKESLERAGQRRLRWAARIGLTVFLINAICARFVTSWMVDRGTFTLSFVADALMIVAVAWLLFYARCLALQIPSKRLARLAVVVGIGWTITGLFRFLGIIPLLSLVLSLWIGRGTDELPPEIVRFLHDPYRPGYPYELPYFCSQVAWFPVAAAFLWFVWRFGAYTAKIIKGRETGTVTGDVP